MTLCSAEVQHAMRHCRERRVNLLCLPAKMRGQTSGSRKSMACESDWCLLLAYNNRRLLLAYKGPAPAEETCITSQTSKPGHRKSSLMLGFEEPHAN